MKRRIRRIRRALKRAGLYNAFHITLIAVLLTGFCVILFNVKEPEQQEKEPEEIQAEVMQNPETMTQTAENIEDKYKVFDTMSEDWGSDDLEGFVFYDLPEQYADKGYFPEKMQIYTRCLCKQYDVPYALVLAIIEQESGYEFDKTGQTKIPRAYSARGTGKFLLIYSATAAFRASTRSVFSHFTPRSSRPMWP